MDNALTLARRLEVRSVRVVGLMLEKFRRALSNEDRALLAGWFTGQLTPDDSDPFPRLCVRPHLIDCERLGPLLEHSQVWMPLDSVSRKTLDQGCVKALNKGKLKDRADTPWKVHFKVQSEVKPVWSMLYKPSLTKNTGDLQ